MENFWGFLGIFACIGAVVAFMLLKGKAWNQLVDDLSHKKSDSGGE